MSGGIEKFTDAAVATAAQKNWEKQFYGADGTSNKQLVLEKHYSGVSTPACLTVRGVVLTVVSLFCLSFVRT